ncbi:MAG: histidine-type phosphatase, partial [Plesiomonas shigelloides]
MIGLWSGLAQASAVAESTASTASATSDIPEMTLEKVVILSRHGVRAPTKMLPLLYQVTPEQWPAWPVPLGDITPRGEHLISLMGRYYREYWREQGLLSTATTASSTASAAETDSTKGCPAPADIYVWADVDERTRKTGEAFLQGLAP